MICQKIFIPARISISESPKAANNLQDAEDNYYLTAKHVLNLADRAYDLFMSSEVHERSRLRPKFFY